MRRCVPALVLAAAGLAALAPGCARSFWNRGPPRIEACEGPLRPTREIPGGDFRLHERVRVVGDEVDLGLELIVERRADRLVVVAFNSFGAKAFTLIQEGSALETTSFLGRALTVPPGNLVRDLDAARFRGDSTPDRVEISRQGCDYTATFVRIERRPLD